MIAMDQCCIPSVFPLPASALLCVVMPAGWLGCGQDYAKRTDGFEQNLVWGWGGGFRGGSRIFFSAFLLNLGGVRVA